MSYNNLTRKALAMLFVPLALSSLPASAYTVDVSENMSSSLNGANFEGYDGCAFYFGFYLDPEKIADGTISEASLRGIRRNGWNNYSYSNSLVVPESVNVNLGDTVVNLTVSSVSFNAESSFENESFKDLIFPAGYNNVEINGSYGNLRGLHFRSESAPTIVMDIESMKNVRLYAPAALADSYNASLSSEGYTVIAETEARMNEESGIPNANATITDADGNVFGIWVEIYSDSGDGHWDDTTQEWVYDYYYGLRDASIKGISTTATSVTLPDNFVLNYEGTEMAFPFTGIEFRDNNVDDPSFGNAQVLTDVYVPKTYESITWNGSFETINARNYHLSSPEVPSTQTIIPSCINIYVPDALWTLYADIWYIYDCVVYSETPATPVTIDVAPGTLADVLSEQDMDNLRHLIVTGSISEGEMRIFRRLPRLEILDLSGAEVSTVTGCNELKYLREVILPEGVTTIGISAFQDCRRLENINFPSTLTEIREEAFRHARLRKISFPASLKTIGSNAFYENYNLTEANLENVESIGNTAFMNCDLRSVNISGLTTAAHRLFDDNYNLTEVIWGEKLSSIENYAFSSCPLSEVILPNSVTYIGYGAFDYNEHLKKVELGENITSLDNNCFNGTSPETVICHMLFPLSYSGFEGANLTNTKLYVPALTLNDYLLSDGYVKFATVLPLPDDLTHLTLDREYTLTNDKGIAENADMTLLESASLTVKRNATLNLGKYIQNGMVTYPYWDYSGYGYQGATIIPESDVTAQEVELNLRLRKDTWHFLSFPFDINVKDIVVDDDALWVVRKYSGADRGQLNSNTWQNMTDETVLKAGEGYIFHCNVEGREEVNFIFRPAADGNALFTKDAVSSNLVSYPSEFAHNASWNLVGNSYPAFVNIKGLGFEAPVTIWQNGSYIAYSPIDDELALTPFQAFFAQRQEVEGGDVITIDPSARAHSKEAALALPVERSLAPARIASAPRSVFNLTVKGEQASDRTRIVVNEAADMAYESARDASKFMSSDANVPQLFVMNGDVRMAIDERPLADGVFSLGAYFNDDKEYAISLDTRNAEGYTVLLTDNETGITTDITSTPYVFNGKKGTDTARFTLTISGAPTGIDGAEVSGVKVSIEGNVLTVTASEAVEIVVAAADGKVVASERSDAFRMELPAGIYVVKAGDKTTKVVAY